MSLGCPVQQVNHRIICTCGPVLPSTLLRRLIIQTWRSAGSISLIDNFPTKDATEVLPHICEHMP